ncbi:hypothetical protein FXO38_26350 [Capsicum annuum]|nr:hypothetical protein FXO38_26350 [Capsicum annuum]
MSQFLNKDTTQPPKSPKPPNPTQSQISMDINNFPHLPGKSMDIDIPSNNSQKESYVGALGYKVGNKGTLKVRLLPRAHEVIDGKTVVFFTKKEHALLVDTCRWTIVGKFATARPTIDKIRSYFAKSVTTKIEVKIGAKDRFHVFIDVDNEDDFNNIYGREYISLSDYFNMKILKWMPNLKLNTETSLAPVWINLPYFPWHFYEWDALCRIVSPVGIPLTMEKATSTKTRLTIAKLRIQVDLAKPLIHSINVEVRNQTGKMEVFEQKIKYETMPAYCSFCKVQGHSIERCISNPSRAQNEENNTITRKGMEFHQKSPKISTKNNISSNTTVQRRDQEWKTDEQTQIMEKKRKYKIEQMSGTISTKGGGKGNSQNDTQKGKMQNNNNDKERQQNSGSYNSFNILRMEEDQVKIRKTGTNVAKNISTSEAGKINQTTQRLKSATRWSKTQKRKEKDVKKKANALNIQNNRSATAAGFSNIDETIQGECWVISSFFPSYVDK